MRSTLSLIAFAAFSPLPAVHANFDIYYMELSRPYAQGGDLTGYQLFEAEPSCEEAGDENRSYQKDLSDVSGDKFGFRCAGKGCGKGGIPEDIDILEMNMNSVHHYSEYIPFHPCGHPCLHNRAVGREFQQLLTFSFSSDL
jgi:hypothetical protein